METKKPIPELNVITAEGVSGKYKDKQFTITIGEQAVDCEILVNGKKIDTCSSIHILMDADKRTKINLKLWSEM